ncbi:hypothetical protein [Lactiplantibacillus plantarum]|uniref:Uncharacterized protein n=1 Tax=Lactiplantibacillus plantarum WJL TaxID=1350466 RepID=A0A837P5P9_LACPN|nr:hypothetical protein [Lactiplantibacillus plantarum]ASL37094.1 hypothetical protein CBI37_06400 [Lactiplantibacillus plantarum]ASZ33195.1 hypothetical protein CLC99_07925 [Lactiplantibacillus plantarum]ERO41065.1 hypothetical protein LPLWJ_18490 [Lactiplantibacillus plantarum WJL]KPN44293.1 hypothetical protein WJL_1370 [Lactiplantibacillus plantarum WJL]WGJ12141.1 hypothetical protein QEO67_04665 [Lactiplantibacillus plantarum]
MDNNKQALATDELATLPLDHNWYQKLASNFEIIQNYLDTVGADNSKLKGLEDKLDDISNAMKTYEANMHELVNILSDYDVPIAVVDGKVTRTEEGD